MKNYLRVIINIFLTSISLSVLLGSFLRIAGPINQSNKINRKINTAEKPRRSVEKEITNQKSNLLLFYDNKLETFDKLEKLINKWESIIEKNPGLEVSCSFLSLEKKVYAEIKSNLKLPAASTIKVPILIVLLRMIDRGEIFWNEKLILTEDTIGGGSGWMAYQEIGKKFPVFEVASEMIRVSDNTATNLLIKAIGGLDIVNQRLTEIGLNETRLNNLLPDLDGTNITTAKELALILQFINDTEFLSIKSRYLFRDVMKNSKPNSLIPNEYSMRNYYKRRYSNNPKTFNQFKKNWLKRKNQIYWRGSTTGGGMLNTKNDLFKLQRVRLCKLHNRNISCNMKISKIVQNNVPKHILINELKKESIWARSVFENTFSNYCCYPDLPGNALAWGSIRKYLMGNLIFKSSTKRQLYYYRFLKPWKHYIPIEENFLDLEEKHSWITSHMEEAAFIAWNGYIQANDYIKNIPEYLISQILSKAT